MQTLNQLQLGQSARIVSMDDRQALTIRMMEMGLMEGEIVELVGVAPLGDPIAISLRGGRLALRRRDASCVHVELQNPD